MSPRIPTTHDPLTTYKGQRLGSGNIERVGGTAAPHRCRTPHESRHGLPRGTQWRCECGQLWRLADCWALTGPCWHRYRWPAVKAWLARSRFALVTLALWSGLCALVGWGAL